MANPIELGQGMTVTRLQIDNFMRVEAVDISPDPTGVTVVSGRNAQGKSSLLRGMWVALGGKAESPKLPIRSGRREARCTVTIGDMVVTRRYHLVDEDSGKVRESLEITSKDGHATYRKPQQLLDGLVSRVAFDPVAFMRYEPRRQVEVLRDVAGVDTLPLENAVAAAFEVRGEQNAVVKTLESRLGDEPPCPDAIDLDDVNRELELIRDTQGKVRECNEAVDKATSKLADRRGKRSTIDEELAELERRKAELLEEAGGLDHAIDQAARVLGDMTELRDAAVHAFNAIADEEELRAQLREGQTVADQRAAHAAWLESSRSLAAERLKAQELTTELEEKRRELRELVQGATYPIDGLEVTAQGVQFEGVPLEQCSSAQQLRVSMGMAMATNPTLRVVHIKEGSLLDSDAMTAVQAMAIEHGYQVWVERVDETGELGVVIEEGRVKGAAAAPAKKLQPHELDDDQGP